MSAGDTHSGAGSAPILVALDAATAETATAMGRRVSPHVAGFKVGLELLMGPGPSVISDIRALGKPVFVDAKLHDIPNTVLGAARQLGGAGARWVTVHASGGRAMIEAAVEGLTARASEPAGILAVTVLTSIDTATLSSVGVEGGTGHQVALLAGLAEAAGAEGAVCSPLEIRDVNRAAPHLITVVPGVRPVGSDSQDQARTATPEAAIAAGASYLVIGRAITGADDPAEAAARIAASIVDPAPDDR